MSQQSIVGRVMQLARANTHAMIDSAEDPQKMLDQLVRDYSAHISAAEQAIAQTIANLRMIEEDQKEEAKAAQQWGKKAQAASKKADELRATGTVRRGRHLRRPGAGGAGAAADRRERRRHRPAHDRRAGRVGGQAQGRPGPDEDQAARPQAQARQPGRPLPQRQAQAQRTTPVRASTSWTRPARSAGSRRRSGARRPGPRARGTGSVVAGRAVRQPGRRRDIGPRSRTGCRR